MCVKAAPGWACSVKRVVRTGHVCVFQCVPGWVVACATRGPAV